MVLKWIVRVAAGVAIGLICWTIGHEHVYIRAWLFMGVAVLMFVAWFESKDRDGFLRRLRDWIRGDDRRGPPGAV
jgi:hypothetical protein